MSMFADYEAKEEKEKDIISARNTTDVWPMALGADSVLENFDDFKCDFDIIHCRECARVMTSLPDLCEDCYNDSLQVQRCMNCETNKAANQFATPESILCLECYNKRGGIMTTREALSKMIFGEELEELTKRYEKTMAELRRKSDTLTERLDYDKLKFDDSYEPSKARLEELTELAAEYKAKNMPEALAQTQSKIKSLLSVMNTTKLEFDQIVKDRMSEIEALTTLQNEKEIKFQEAVRALRVDLDVLCNVRGMINKGTATRKEILQANNLYTPKMMMRFETFFEDTGIVSDGLKRLENKIRKGEKINTKLIRKAENPVDAFVEEHVTLATKLNASGAEVPDLRKKVKARDLYNHYKATTESPIMSEKAFAQLVTPILASYKVVKKQVHNSAYYCGIMIEEEEDD